MEEGIPIESRLITRRIEAAQKAVEAQNFEARKHLLEYDDVMNKQREAVYGLRRQLLEGVDQKDLILEDYVSGILSDVDGSVLPGQSPSRRLGHQRSERRNLYPLWRGYSGRRNQARIAKPARTWRRHL